jgi:hypothetical protein
MSAAKIWAVTRTRLRWALIQVPSGLILPIIVVWGADFTIRHHLNWAVLAWFLILGGVWAYVLLPVVIPPLLIASAAANRAHLSPNWRGTLYAVTLGAVGAAIGANTDAISSLAAAVCGFLSGVMIAHIESKGSNAT